MATHPLTWMADLALPKLTLLFNHILASEPVATAKLTPHAGRSIHVKWASDFHPPLPRFLTGGASTPWTPPDWLFVITPAGLLETQNLPVNDADSATTVTSAHIQAQAPTNGLVITVHLPDPLNLARQLMTGRRPEVNIEGDAALAEVAAWMMKHLRWDIEDDLARWLGSTPAELLRHLGEGLRQALARWRPSEGTRTGPQA